MSDAGGLDEGLEPVVPDEQVIDVLDDAEGILVVDSDVADVDDVGPAGDDVPAANARSVLDYLVRSVVDDPDAVTISVTEGRRGPSLDVRVADGDMGRVIGKRGRVAQAIRTVVRAAAVKDGVAVDIEFVD